MLLEEYEMKRHDGFMNAQDSFEQLETVIKPEIIQDIYTDRLKQSPSPVKKRLNQDQNELTPEYLDAIEESLRQDEYGNNTIKISTHYKKTGKLNEITSGMKEIYKALRTRDSNIDDTLDIKVDFSETLWPDLTLDSGTSKRKGERALASISRSEK